MREMISVHIADQIADQDASGAHTSGATGTVSRIREHIWTKRSKIQRLGAAPPPIMHSEQLAAGHVPTA